MSIAAPSSTPTGLLRRLLRPLIGDVQWLAPGWLRGLGNAAGFFAMAFSSWVRSDMRRAAIAGGVGLALIAGGVAGKAWYDRLPKPHEVTVEVVTPDPTPVDQPNAKPDPLMIKFSESAKHSMGLVISTLGSRCLPFTNVEQ